METYDSAKIGKRIAWGRSHSVYRYGTDEVIKFPKLERWLGLLLLDRLERDISVCREYFGDFFLDTRIVQDPKSGKMATIQPYATGHYLSKKDLQEQVSQKQFEAFLQCQEAMTRAGYAPVDLVGQGGVFRRCLSNVLVLDDKRLKLFDAAILDTRDIKAGAYTARFIIRLVEARQRSTLRYLLS